MRHHVQEKKKRKLSHGATSAEMMHDASSWSNENDTEYDNNDSKAIAMTGGQPPPAEQDSSVWKTDPNASCRGNQD